MHMRTAVSNPWIRLYREALHDPKIVTLGDRQHRAWHNALLIADDTGKLPSMRDIAVHMRVTVTEAEQLICDLVEAELIDAEMQKGGGFAYRMHSWEKRQYVSDSSTERVRKHRARKQRATAVKRFSNGDVAPPDTDAESETDTELPPTKSENTSLPPEQEAARESGKVHFYLSRVGSRRVGGEPSAHAKLEAARVLNVADVEPLVDRYRRWPESKSARDPDALFVASAPKLFQNASKAVREACKPIEQPMPEALRPVVASQQLTALLAGRRR
jgi:hypothetical protein